MESATAAPETTTRRNMNKEPREYIVLRKLGRGNFEDADLTRWEEVWEGEIAGGANAARDQALDRINDEEGNEFDAKDLTLVVVAKRHWTPRSPRTKVVQSTTWE